MYPQSRKGAQAITAIQRTSLLVVLAVSVVGAHVATAATPGPRPEKIPVIYDSDIGGDMDDTWALCQLLNSPELDLKLIVTGLGDATSKARYVAKILQTLDRTDIPIGIGPHTGSWKPNNYPWYKNFDVSKYEGKIIKDGVGELIKTVMADNTGKINIVAAGPMQNIGAALRREPKIAPRTEFVAMFGCIRTGGPNHPEIKPENNVRVKLKASQRVAAADWKKVTLGPSDTGAYLRLKGENFQRVFKSEHPLARVITENHLLWAPRARWYKANPREESSTLWDTLAVHLAHSDKYVKLERLPIYVDDKAYTRIDPKRGKPMYCATEWKDLDGYMEMLIKRVTTWSEKR